jgi:hypothetical protein
MQPIIIKSSRGKYILLTVLSLAFVAAAIVMVTSASASRAGNAWKGWLGIVFFGACAAVGVWQTLDPRPRLIIDDEGVFDRTLKVGRIPWSEIAGVHLPSMMSKQFICLDLRDEDRWIASLARPYQVMVKGNEALGFTRLNLNLSGTNANTAELLPVLQRKCAEHATRQAAG